MEQLLDCILLIVVMGRIIIIMGFMEVIEFVGVEVVIQLTFIVLSIMDKQLRI